MPPEDAPEDRGREAGDDPDPGGDERTDLAPAEAFAALSDPLRIDILEALAAFHREGERTVRYSTLRKAVDVRDSGRFRYHLNQLLGAFVEKADEGYRLAYAGNEVVNAIIAGTYTSGGRLGPTDLDSTCSLCGGPARATYEDGLLEVACPNDHPLFVWTLPPNAADAVREREADEDDALRELVGLATTLAYQSYELVVDGTCSECYSAIDPRLRAVEAEGQPVRFTARCEACGAAYDGPVGFALLGHPEVEAHYHRSGRPVRGRYWWELSFVTAAADVERIDDDPLRVRLVADLDGAELAATVEADGTVSDVTVAE